jgi:hypothetical protein
MEEELLKADFKKIAMQFFLVESLDLRVKSFGEFFFIALRKIFDFVI